MSKRSPAADEGLRSSPFPALCNGDIPIVIENWRRLVFPSPTWPLCTTPHDTQIEVGNTVCPGYPDVWSPALVKIIYTYLLDGVVPLGGGFFTYLHDGIYIGLSSSFLCKPLNPLPPSDGWQQSHQSTAQKRWVMHAKPKISMSHQSRRPSEHIYNVL